MRRRTIDNNISYPVNWENQGPPEKFTLAEFREWFTEAQLIGRTPIPAVVATAMNDLLTRAEAAEAELRRVRTAYGEKSLENERIKESLREILYGPRNADGRSEQVAT